MSRTVWINGEFLPFEEARLPLMDRGFLFADGIYEVTAVLDGRLIDSASHLARFQRSAESLDIAFPWPVDAIEAMERDLIARNGMEEGTVYLQITRGVAERDFVSEPESPTFVAFTQPKQLIDNPAATTGIKVVSLPDIRWARRDIKSVMLLAQVLAKREAAARGAQEAWMIEDGFVTEGASSTAWIVTADGTLVTRPNGRAILPGCTRAAVEALGLAEGIRIEARAFTLAEAQSAREAMMTSASTFVLPVVMIDGQPVGDGRPGPIAAKLRALYIAAARSLAA